MSKEIKWNGKNESDQKDSKIEKSERGSITNRENNNDWSKYHDSSEGYKPTKDETSTEPPSDTGTNNE